MTLIVAAALPLAFVAAATSGKPKAWFTDVTEGSGIPPLKYGEGANFVDLDGDGLPELFLTDVKGKNRLYRNLGGGRFADMTESRGLGESSGGIGAVFGDLDGDGLDDLYVVRGASSAYGENLVYRQDDGGVFRDVSREAGASWRRNGMTAVLGDADGDGRPDLFVTNWGRNALYLNRSAPGAIRFADAGREWGLAEEGRSWAALFSDLDGDGLPDLFVSRGGPGPGEEQKLYIGRRNGTFEDASARSGIRGIRWSLGAVSADFDGEGDFDLFVGNYDGPARLYRNEGGGRFTDVTERCGIRADHTIGAAAGDIDGDLLPDLVVAGWKGPVRLFRNLGGMRFEDVGEVSGIGPFARNEAVVLADIDGDGDLDLYVANRDGRNRLYRNDLDDPRCLKVRLDTRGGPCEGAVARLYRPGGLGRADALLAARELSAGGGYCSQSPRELLFRLPDAGPRDLRVTFPGGSSVETKGVAPGTIAVSRPGARR